MSEMQNCLKMERKKVFRIYSMQRKIMEKKTSNQDILNQKKKYGKKASIQGILKKIMS